jgi:branched-subunit amino acid transport protein AzlD
MIQWAMGTYSVLTTLPASTPPAQMAWLGTLNQAWWVGGTALGALVGAQTRFPLAGLDFVLAALFAVLVATQWLARQPIVQLLGRFLPLAIMTLLLAHSMAGSARDHARGPWAELIAVALVMLLQWRIRNPLLSIGAGTAAYLLLRHGLAG